MKVMTAEELRRYNVFLTTFKDVPLTALRRALNDHVNPGIKLSGGFRSLAEEWARLDATPILGKAPLCSRSIDEVIAGVEAERQDRMRHPNPSTRARAAQQPKIVKALDPKLPNHRFLRPSEVEAIVALARHAMATTAPGLKGSPSPLIDHVAEVQRMLGNEIKI